ncbi:MAG: cytochrome C oxidase subunit I [Gammaproteobacteria bacterium]|nr:cytochrome C oxidase subunit I [Gammaproteobacteria bacterium]
MATASEFRTCPDTGLLFHKPAEKLMKINAVVAVVFLLVGGVLGLLVGLTRWPAVHLLGASDFYMVLTAHGIDVLIYWLIFFEMAVLYFCSSTLLGCRLATPRIAWLAFALMLIGAIVNNIAVFQGNSSVMFTSYVPMSADPMFYLGLIVFAVGALLGCFVFLGTLVIAKAEKTYEGSLPLVTFGALTAAIIAIFTIASGAIILIPTFLFSIGFISEIDPLMYRVIWWAFGHSSQQINMAAMVAVWYAVAAVAFGAKPLSEKVSRAAFLLYIIFLQLASAHHILVDPGVSSTWKIFNTSYAMYLAVLASMIHGLTVPGAIEASQRKRGFNKGLFEWLRKAPWGNPAFSGVFMSLVLFGFLGGISGVVMGTEQINLIIHNTIYVPGHFHATVVLGTTLAFMALTYWLVPVLFRRDLVMKGLAKWQPYIFALGMSGVAVFMMGAGTLGVPRRHWDLSFVSAAFTHNFPETAYTLLGLMGISVVLAVIGGAAFCGIIVASLLFGKRLSLTEKGETPLVAEPITSYEGVGMGKIVAPGTFVLALVFLVSFVLYYFVNWKFLAETWGIS